MFVSKRIGRGVGENQCGDRQGYIMWPADYWARLDWLTGWWDGVAARRERERGLHCVESPERIYNSASCLMQPQIALIAMVIIENLSHSSSNNSRIL